MADASKFKRMETGVKGAFGKVRDELDDHRESINQNSAEIQSLYEYIHELEQKLVKLQEHMLDAKRLEPLPIILPLSYREQEVFLALYTAELPLTATEIAAQLGLAHDVIFKYVRSLITKGVPILHHVHEHQEVFSLELKFKDLQAKKNIVPIDAGVSEGMTREEMI